MQIKKIFSKRIAIALRELGFKIVGTEVNYKKPQFDVYLFVDTEELEEALNKLL